MIQQYGQEKAEEIIEYSYNNSTDPTRPVLPPNQHLQQRQPPNHTLPQQRPQSAVTQYPTNVNKYSPAYARIIGAKPKATASANIRLGGVYR